MEAERARAAPSKLALVDEEDFDSGLRGLDRRSHGRGTAADY